MYLNALELQGFKSFPDKTRLNFDQEITAIVGPNGSGKSNISDAILWVMGEQRTKTLRGGKMEDVIFGGTEKRSPMGFAQVSLILDNSTGIFDTENTEVMITRRYYRSGESEYSINREPCRLRDINELLMDTGLGRDGYSIIGQGRIAEIVSGKSNERREIFEEAAGISRYRYRKEESERKLARTEENLLRINDKVDELELQVEPLRKQAETAKKYLRLRDELKSAEVSVWMETLDRLHAQAETVNHDYQTAKENLAGAQRELEQLYAASENIAQKMREKDLESERTREQISEAESAAAECESAAAVVRTNLQNSADSIARLRVEVSEQTDRADALQAQIDAQQRRLQEIEADPSTRSYGIEEAERMRTETGLDTAHARNYKCAFVPYPIPPIGKVSSGIMTLSTAPIASAERIALPSPFKWPVSVANLKRCLMPVYIDLEGTDAQLVLVNLHLEAYDDGEGKAAQTAALTSFLEQEYAKGNYVIAGGDFNQTFPGGLDKYPIKNADLWTPGTLDDSMLPDGWHFAYDTATPTCRLDNQPYDAESEATQHYVIDGFILSPNVELTSVQTQDDGFRFSDHNPVLLSIRLK